jgi:hypothetical protein
MNASARRNRIVLSYGLWSLWDMAQTYFPIYKIALDLQKIRSKSELLKVSGAISIKKVLPFGDKDFLEFVEVVKKESLNCRFLHTADLANRIKKQTVA